MLPEKETNHFIDLVKQGYEIAPDFMGTILLSLGAFVDINGGDKKYWYIWGGLSGKVQEIAKNLVEYQEGPRYREKRKMLRDFMFADFSWQPKDYERQQFILGKEYILNFVQNVGFNSDVFEAMASLMYHFPDVFLKSGLIALSKHQQSIGGTYLFSGKNTAFYLERSIQRFLMVEHPGPLSKEYHESCKVLLDAIVETASSSAYFLREHLIRSRRIYY